MSIRSVLHIMIFSAALFVLASASYAQQEPALPEPLENLRKEGAQMRFLGNKSGLNGWIAIKNGQEQYFYVTEDGQAFVMGLLFNKNGKIETLKQVQKLQQESGGEMLDLFASDDPAASSSPQDNFDQMVSNTQREFKPPAEQLYDDVDNSNWIQIGDGAAPYIYAFMDPQCPHCHAFMNDLRPYIDNGTIQLRIIPVGFRDDTRAQAAFLLAVPNPQKRWFAHLDGDDDALPVTPDINQQGVQRNLAVMQSWKINVTPFTVYRTTGGEVKIVQGRVQDPGRILADVR